MFSPHAANFSRKSLVFLLLALLPALLAARLLGGQLSRVFDYPWRRSWLIWASMAVQLPLFSPIGEQHLSHGQVAILHVATYIPTLVFFALNLGSGLALMLTGTVLNLIPIIANGGHMPVDPRAWNSAFPGRPLADGDAANTVVTGVHHLQFLGDTMAMPDWFLFSNAFSIGDLLLAVGLMYTFCRLSSDAPPIGRALLVDLTRMTRALAAGGTFRATYWATFGDWMIIACAAGWAAVAGGARFVAILLAARLVPGMLAATRRTPGLWTRVAPLAAGGAAIALAVSVANGWTIAVSLSAVALGAARGASSGTREVGRVSRDDLDRALLAASLASRLAMGTGLAAGAIATMFLGPASGLAVAAAILLVSIPTAVATGRGERLSADSIRDVAGRHRRAMLLVSACAVGAAAIATSAPAIAEHAVVLGGGRAVFGWLFGALAVGLLCGQLVVWSFVQTGGNGGRAIGLALSGLAVSLGLAAGADLVATLGCATGVAGLSLGAADALLRLEIARTGERRMWQAAATALGAGAIAGLVVAAFAGNQGQVLWIACGAVLVVSLLVLLVGARASVVSNGPVASTA